MKKKTFSIWTIFIFLSLTILSCSKKDEDNAITTVPNTQTTTPTTTVKTVDLVTSSYVTNKSLTDDQWAQVINDLTAINTSLKAKLAVNDTSTLISDLSLPTQFFDAFWKAHYDATTKKSTFEGKDITDGYDYDNAVSTSKDPANRNGWFSFEDNSTKEKQALTLTCNIFENLYRYTNIKSLDFGYYLKKLHKIYPNNKFPSSFWYTIL
jgi:hypothetical protein